MGIMGKLKRRLTANRRTPQYLAELVAGSDNQQRLFNDKIIEVIACLANMTNVMQTRLDAVIAGSESPAGNSRRKVRQHRQRHG
jgi:hypothetical protein